MSVPYFMGDDEFPAKPKTKRLLETAIDGDRRGPAALGVWFAAGCQVQHDCGSDANRTGDGVIERIELIRIFLNADIVDEAAALLVEHRFWHAPGHTCETCPPAEAGTWVFHDWFQMKYSPGKTVALNRNKRSELKDATLIAKVWARDCTDPANPWVGQCRYCGTTVRKKDNRSDDRQPEMDHVDPKKAAGVHNVVLSCRTCNKHKGARTPEQAGMQLLPQPAHSIATLDDAGSAGPASSRDDAGRPATGSTRRPTPPARDEAPRPAEPTPINLGATPSRALTGDEQGPDRPAAPAVDQPAATHRVERPGNASGPPPDHGPTKPDQGLDHADRTVPGGRAPGQGQGQGLGRGVGKGAPQPPTSGETRSQRRRRRRRARSEHPAQSDISMKPSTADVTPTTAQPNPHDAGAPPPDVLITEGFGSPWYGHRGPPSTVGTETDCADHHLPLPCWKCAAERNNS